MNTSVWRVERQINRDGVWHILKTFTTNGQYRAYRYYDECLYGWHGSGNFRVVCYKTIIYRMNSV